MEITAYACTLTFVEPLLGGVPDSKTIYSDYIAARAEAERAPAVPHGGSGSSGSNGRRSTADELETVPDFGRGKTGFHRDERGRPLIYDYVLRGYFKEAAKSLRLVDKKSRSAALKAYKTLIDAGVLVNPRRIPITVGGPTFELERPLRAETPQGPRVALVSSYAVPAGSTLAFEIEVLGDVVSEELLREWLTYGRVKGLGQWRSGGYGRFTYTLARK